MQTRPLIFRKKTAHPRDAGDFRLGLPRRRCTEHAGEDKVVEVDYAGLCAKRRADPDFRLAVNRALAVTYRAGAIVSIFDRWFAPFKPGVVLIAVYGLDSMEE